MITITSTRHGLVVDCDCVVQNGIPLTPERCSAVCYVPVGYIKGLKEPHHQVPAIYRGPLYADYFYLGYVTAENGWHVEDVYRHLGIN